MGLFSEKIDPHWQLLRDSRGFLAMAVKEGTIIHASRGLLRLLERDSLVGESILQILPSEYWLNLATECPPFGEGACVQRTKIRLSNGEEVYANFACERTAQDSNFSLWGALQYGQAGESISLNPGSDELVRRQHADSFAMLSHEIRTPIASMLGLIELIRTEDLAKDQQRIVEAISTSIVDVQTLLNDVLDASRLSAGQLKLNKEPFQLQPLCERLVERAQLLYPDLNVRLDYSPELGENFYADSHRVRQIISNILSNALKYTHEGSVELKVSRGQGKYNVLITVKDTGVGITDEQQIKLFHAYQRGDIGSKTIGTGLGLYITHLLVELHGGSIAVQSKSGKGTTVSITLPIAIAVGRRDSISQSTMGQGMISQEVFALPEWFEKRPKSDRVLLVDDNHVNVMVVQKFFERWSIEHDTAPNGKQALARLAEQDYALVLMDIRMPGIDGFETTKRIRALDSYAQYTPIVALTASTEPGIKERIREAGFNGYIFKPFNWINLQEVIELFLKGTKS